MKDMPSAKAQARARAQCDRILDAAQQCFIEHGFHAASMANIADAAHMSAGLIYRYFENKNAIILAIIQRQLQGARADIATLQSDTDIAALIVRLFTRWRDGDPKVMNPALFLEMSAQASRDPQIAQAVHDADRVSEADASQWLQRVARAQAWDTPEEIRVRALILRCFIEGLAVRTVREPDLDLAVLAESVQLLVQQLLPTRSDGAAAARP